MERSRCLAAVVLCGAFGSSALWALPGDIDISCADANGDGQLDLSDSVHILSFLFLGGQPPSCPVVECRTEDGRPLPTAPESARVDLYEPIFSNPTSVTNALFPISQLHSVVMLGKSDGERFRSEVTLLPGTRAIALGDRVIQTLESQYMAFVDGRIHEVALDWYGQDDQGAVWYFGEDVYNYEDGTVADRHGTWLAGRDGPVAMIMPASPRVGGVYRPENICGLVFEEVKVRAVNVAVEGPGGMIQGAIVAHELHQDLSEEDKVFAPGYGEFSTGAGDNVEALALAAPADVLPGAVPAALELLENGAEEIFREAPQGDWADLEDERNSLEVVWADYREDGVPGLLGLQMEDALEALGDALDTRNSAETRQAALDLARATLDFRLRHRPVAEIDLGRFELWAFQVLVDAEEGTKSLVLGDVTSLEWTRDRFSHTLSASVRSELEDLLKQLRSAAELEELDRASELAQALLLVLDRL